jgi:hypothetical protein
LEPVTTFDFFAGTVTLLDMDPDRYLRTSPPLRYGNALRRLPPDRAPTGSLSHDEVLVRFPT